MQKDKRCLRALLSAVVVGMMMTAADCLVVVSLAQGTANQALTPLQTEIEKLRLRLGSAEVEDRREALVRLGSLQHPVASRVALSALNDPAAIVRATAAASVLSLPPNESVASLVPLLRDKDEFVRQQVAYALGHIRSPAAVAPLIECLTDKMDSVRGAAAVALGQIADATAVASLAAILNPQAGLTASKNKSKREQNPFVLRAAAHSLGQIGNRAGLPALIFVLQDEKVDDDVRREAAFALGAIGDPAAVPALRSVLAPRDPYLSQTAHEAIKRISQLQTTGGN